MRCITNILILIMLTNEWYTLLPSLFQHVNNNILNIFQRINKQMMAQIFRILLHTFHSIIKSSEETDFHLVRQLLSMESYKA